MGKLNMTTKERELYTDETGNFLGKYNLAKLTLINYSGGKKFKQIDFHRRLSPQRKWSKNYPTKKIIGPDVFTGKLYQIFKYQPHCRLNSSRVLQMKTCTFFYEVLHCYLNLAQKMKRTDESHCLNTENPK